ncbi:MAG: hypothetical protein EAZ85_00995 [Bacteroidetes bacterium]|nr:MAG: hypothetical protein EAZ85_00995 [Bacteroidota bacterium]TAG85482.1 MAG: hypothetical protein EAZ20_15030 [Bacteroidota bacterium]
MKKNRKHTKNIELKSIKVSDKLNNFDIFIDSFGKINAVYDVDKINNYLNSTLDDKKLRNLR